MKLNKNQNVVEGNNEAVEAKEPGKIRQFIDKHEITPNKVLKAAGKALVLAGAGAGLFILGRDTGKSNDDKSDEADHYDVPIQMIQRSNIDQE